MKTETQRKGAAPSRVVQIEPYWDDDQAAWVFDDSTRGLVRTPFVDGMTEMIDRLVCDLPDAKGGFRMTLSALPFPAYRVRLRRIGEDCGGYHYASEDPHFAAWLGPALLQYFPTPPPDIYLKVEARPVCATT